MLKARLTKLTFLWAALALFCLMGSLLPSQYVATARVLLPPQEAAPGGSRVRELRHVSLDARAAAAKVDEMVASLGNAILVDETRVRAGWAPAWLIGPALLFAWLFLRAWARSRLHVPERALVREAVLLAQRGHPAVLVDMGGRFRVVLGDSAPDRETLPVLAKLSSGALVLARRA